MKHQVRHFRGTLLGVTAHAALDLKLRHAELELSGAVLGGRLQGGGTLSGQDNHGQVVLDRALQRSLALRFVSVQSAVFDPDAGTIRVCLKLPVIGDTEIVLRELP